MHFAPLSLLAILATAVAAQGSDNPFKINSGFSVTAGKPATIEWTPTTSGPVSLSLRSGASSNLEEGTVIASSIPNSGKYTFTLPADTTRNSDYTIQIVPVGGSDDKANFTPQFVVESSNTVKSISSASNSASATATSRSSASSASSNTRSTSTSRATSTSSSTRTASSAAATTDAAAPTSNAAVNNLVNFQGGLVAVLLGAAAAF